MAMLLVRAWTRVTVGVTLLLSASSCASTVQPSDLADIVQPFEAAKIVREGIRPLDIITGDDVLDALPARSVLSSEAGLKPLTDDAAWFIDYFESSNTGFVLLGSLIGEPVGSLKSKLRIYGVENVRVIAGRAEIEQVGFGEVLGKASLLTAAARRALVDEGRGMVVAVLYVYGLRVEFLDARGGTLDLESHPAGGAGADPANDQAALALKNVQVALGIIKSDARVAVGLRVHIPTEAERELIQHGFVKAEPLPFVNKNVVIKSDRARLVEGDWEVHSDDWTRVVISYELKPTVDQKGIDCLVSMEVSELHHDKRFRPGRTRILTSGTATFPILDTTSQRIVKGIHRDTQIEDQDTYYLPGRLSGWIPLGDLGALRGIEVSVDGRGSNDKKRQGFKATVSGVALVGNALD